MVIGITGGTACGQTTVSKSLEKKGVFLISADTIAKQLVDNNLHIRKKLIENFGQDIIDSEYNLNRKQLGQIVFSNQEKLKQLNQIVHPVLLQDLRDRIQQAQKKNRYVAVDAALLVEKGLTNWFDKLIVVYADKAIRIKRLLKRDHLTELAARERISSQLPIEKKMEVADYVICNSGTLSETTKQIEEIWQKITEK